MKTAISLPDSVFAEAETLAQQLGLSRSELYTQALLVFLQKYNRSQTFIQLNEVYGQESAEVEPVIAKMQLMSLPVEDW